MVHSYNEGYVENDDEIQYLRHISAKPFHCNICHQVLDKQSPEQRQAHYERHFSDEPEASGSVAKPIDLTQSSQPKTGSWKRMVFHEEKDIFWYPSQTKPPPPNFTPGLIPVLKRALLASHSKGNTRRAVLCYDRTVHIVRDMWDATWGCGYRNFEMACTALMDQPYQPLYFPLLDAPISPSVRNLQRWIEAAWKEGFDPEGAQQLKKLVGTNKWIGTSDIWVAFSFRGIPAELVDFNIENEPKGTEIVTNWIVKYFSPSGQHNHHTVDDTLRGASPVICTDHMPIILQHKGHSRTIVGYEISRKGAVNLLTFDPSARPSNKLRDLALPKPPSTPPVQLSISQSSSSHGLRHFFNSIPNGLNKRRASNPKSDGKGDEVKRPRSNVGDDDVIIISDSSDGGKSKQKAKNNEEGTFNAADILNFFRIDHQKLGSKSYYQILYFPLEDPLDEKQRLSRKEVTTTKEC